MVDSLLNDSLADPINDVSTQDPRSRAGVFLQAASMVIIILVALGGNLLILAAIYIDKTLQTITNVFIINLACADLLLTMIGMPFTLASSITYDWIFGNKWCKVNGMANSLFCIASILTLAAVSIDRYCAILYPFKYGTWITNKVAAGMITYIWFHALLMACLPLTDWTQYTFIRSESICTVEWGYSISYTIFLFSVCFFLPLAVMMVTYLKIFRTAKMQSRRVVPVTGSIGVKGEASSSEYSGLRGDSQSHLNSSSIDPFSILSVKNQGKNQSSLNSDMYDEKLISGRQTPGIIYNERNEVTASSFKMTNTDDQPTKDSGYEEGGSTSYLKPRRISSEYGSLGRESVLNSSCESIQDSVIASNEPICCNIHDRQCASTLLDRTYVDMLPPKTNTNILKRKTGAIYLPPLQNVKGKEEMKAIMQHFNQPRADLGNLNNCQSSVNESTKDNDVNNMNEYPSYPMKNVDNLEIRTSCRSNSLSVGAIVQPRQTKAHSVSDFPRQSSQIPVVVSQSASHSSFAFSSKSCQEGGRASPATRRKKLSTVSISTLKNFAGPNAFRAFSKSKLALDKLRKRKDVQARAKMRRETKAAKTLLIVVGTFVLCWTPHFIGIFCLLFEDCSWPDEFFAITTWLAMLNSACNPVIYGVMSRHFRKRFKQILQCKRGFF
ncbi:tyramine/octopamine receptor-like [Stylophora pistillata]|uniref:tyramine/octopamine receptor-like n=1 Tax=Stylophora pistillata TaxID=50429 RepID=UPI000C03CC4C|nr:tyramine/octopamine receptor-like [Stylophora pistillata]